MTFQDIQYQFAAHIRNPSENVAPSDIEPRRMKVYSELFFNNVENFISSGFPILRSLYENGDWNVLVRNFFQFHKCSTPYFLEITQEFIQFLQTEYKLTEHDYPFMVELAHYEWVELALDVSDTEIPLDVEEGDLLERQPVVSPLIFALAYQFPVHQIGPKFTPKEPGEMPTYLLVYRTKDDDVRFMETNAVTMRMLNLLQETNATGHEALSMLAKEMQHPDPEVVISGGLQTLKELREKDIILGVRK